jgi:YebC/PmpR family DNA-binding regulatory protein
MSGHSKWSTIKRKKGKTDAARGRAFTKVAREIITAAREGSGGDPDMNPRLRTAIIAAKAINMPADNIKKAIQRGTGELPGATYEEATYEAYGPAGVAILVQTLTDNKNRTVAEIRHLLLKTGGSMGEAGCVSWMFQKSGTLEVPGDSATEDVVLDVALDAGATDVVNDGEAFMISCEVQDLEAVKVALEAKNITVASAEMAMVPQTTIKLDDKHAEQMIRLMDALEEQDDVQKVWANFDIDDEIMEKISSQAE